MKSRLIPAFKILASLAFLAAIWAWIEPAELAARLRRADPLPFAAAVALGLLGQVLNALKLRAFFPAPRPSLRGLSEVNFVSAFFSSFIPGGVGGEVARWAYLSREAGSAGRALAAVLLDRLTGLWAQILLALAAWVWIGRGGLSLWPALALAVAVLAASLWTGAWGYRWFTGTVAKLGAWYARRSGNAAADPGDLGAAFKDLLAKRSRFAKVAALSVFNHTLVILAFVLLDRTAGGNLGWAQAALYIFCYTFVILLPLTVGTWGLSEGILGILYGYGGSGGETGVLLSLLMRASGLPGVLIGWGLFLARKRRAPAA